MALLVPVLFVVSRLFMGLLLGALKLLFRLRGRQVPIRRSRAVSTSGDWRIIWITSSRFARAMSKPSRICALARALSNSKRVRRTITFCRWSI